MEKINKPIKDPNDIERTFFHYFERIGDHNAAAILTLVEYIHQLVTILKFSVRDDQNNP